MESEGYTGMSSERYTDLHKERPLFYEIKNITSFHEGILGRGDKVICISNNLRSKWDE